MDVCAVAACLDPLADIDGVRGRESHPAIAFGDVLIRREGEFLEAEDIGFLDENDLANLGHSLAPVPDIVLVAVACPNADVVG